MKAENILNALGDVKDEYLADAEKAGAGRTKKQYWLKLGAAAACLCLIAGGIFAVPRLMKKPGLPIPSPNGRIEREEIPDVWPEHTILRPGDEGYIDPGPEPIRDVQEWNPSMKAKDYFKNSGKGNGSDGLSAAADLVMGPSAVMVPLEDRREEFEADEILPQMEDRTEYDFCAEYNGDGSLYKLTFLWMRRGDNAEYSDLTLTAAPKEPHEVNCCAVAEGVGGGHVPPYVTVTERDGVLIYAKGRENHEKTLTWQTEAGWYEIRGSFNDSYENTAALLDWFWEHPLDLALFADPPEGSMIFSTRAEHPEAFRNQIPDFEALGYAAESELVNLGEHWGETVPVWFEGVYSRGDVRIRWSISLGADRDAWDACLGRPGEFTEDQLTEALKDRDFVNIFFDRTKVPPLPSMATAKLENGSAADLWEVIKSLEN